MDLPNNTPAGSEAMPAFAGKGGAAANGELAKARENVAATSVIAAEESSHGHVRGRFQKLIGDPSRTWAVSFVLGRMQGIGGPDSTQEGQKRRKTGAHSSPDAQGPSKMIKRSLTPIVATASVLVASFALHSCGQKPAPAAETPAADKAASERQSMRVTRVALRNLSDEIIANGRLVVREEAAVGSELPGYRVAQVYVDEGDWVKQGQALARLDDTLLQAQIAQ
ncbi:MAG TPA: biotin/lipoyl-binding protein, partial [Hyphomonadaceae bacterium]|nr:biotin/lipoyl-binding protein [Hyphomonadaceae bacterium]